ncbi:uncharacterized protein PITG_08107 [Phytophthora infestans T30-4]|uniref:Uncharacterized protein n=1 Tax=Phytophthora infestans (strain T30-4) TaxID=403677 RepID=D0N9H4_PHYIT|nr:uncharacterized protein PITG_08107 [Phytophthora infestans T30-4]EEY54462.1 hypothetical protein PITG_08107 [Phytophthora infestans T30-4]|eukprot:XP_002904284.1 hypothetical protein PITG_08107 [Phytophthora infestans T30-4]
MALFKTKSRRGEMPEPIKFYFSIKASADAVVYTCLKCKHTCIPSMHQANLMCSPQIQTGRQALGEGTSRGTPRHCKVERYMYTSDEPQGSGCTVRAD